MMKRKRTSEMFVILGLFGYLTIPVHGEAWDFTWVHPCDQTSQTCGGGCQFCFPPPPIICRCEADYNEVNNWSSIGGGYPDASTDSAIVEHSNTGYCDGGIDDGEPCSQDTDCAGQNIECKNYEEYLVIHLIDETIEFLNIRTKITTATNDKLDIRLSKLDVCIGGTNNGTECAGDGDCTGGGTCDQGTKVLTVGALTLDAIDGPITLTAVAGNIETE